ncbi:MAG: PhoU domain-containing protein [Nitrososphaerales archaeon]
MVQIREETRKIQFTGKSSYIISLPKKWVEDIGLKAGDSVAVVRQGNSLLQIGPSKKHLAKGVAEASIEVGINDDVSIPIRKMIALYILGFNIINIKARDGRLQTKQREAVKSTVRKVLMGAEIIADSTDGLTVQVLINMVELSVDAAFKRMLLIAKSMLKDAILALKESNRELAREVITSDDEVDRFSFYIIRQLNIAIQNEHLLADMGLLKPRDCLGYRSIVKSIERAADHAANIAEDIFEMETTMGSDLVAKIENMSNFALEVLDDACLSLFKRDYAEAERAIEKSKHIDDLEEQILGNPTSLRNINELYRIKLITENLRRIAEYASDIAEIVLNMTVEQSLKQGKA